jgi:hypothetical protein
MYTNRASRRLAMSALACACALAGACASVPTHVEEETPLWGRVDPTRARRSLISHEELQTAHAASTPEMIRALRPEFLQASHRSEGPFAASPVVYVNHSYLGDMSWLELIPLREVRHVEFLHAMEGRARFGPLCRCDGGALVISTSLSSDGR